MKQDCKGGADECQPGCIKGPFSNEKSMVKNKGMLVLIGILGETRILSFYRVIQPELKFFQGLASFFGNFTVIVTLVRVMTRPSGRNSSEKKASKLNSVLILNLSVSDLLVSVSFHRFSFIFFSKNMQEFMKVSKILIKC